MIGLPLKETKSPSHMNTLCKTDHIKKNQKKNQNNFSLSIQTNRIFSGKQKKA